MATEMSKSEYLGVNPSELHTVVSDLEKAANEAKAKAAEATRNVKAAKAALDGKAKPFRITLTTLRDEQSRLRETHKAAVRVIDEEFAAQNARIESMVENLHRKAEDAGIPRSELKVLPKKGTSSEERKSVPLSAIGAVGPVTVTAPHRSGDKFVPVTVVYQVFESVDDEGPIVKAKRVDNGHGQISESKMEADWSQSSTTLSAVATRPGWHETSDVLYALLVASGQSGDYPNVKPSNPSASISVNGKPLSDECHDNVAICQDVL